MADLPYQRWEYYVHTAGLRIKDFDRVMEAELDEIGAKGWEAVSMVAGPKAVMILLRRPLLDDLDDGGYDEEEDEEEESEARSRPGSALYGDDDVEDVLDDEIDDDVEDDLADEPDDEDADEGVLDLAVPEIDVEELEKQLASGARIVDVRQPDEYEDAHVPGAALVPLAQVLADPSQFAGDGALYVICKSGGRSLKASESLRAAGVDAINVAGGTMAWIEASKPTVSGSAES